MRSGGAIPFTLAAILLFPLFSLGSEGQKPAEVVEKPKPGKPGEAAKDDKPGKDEKKEEKPKDEDKPGPPTIDSYIKLLKSDNALVRKRAVLVLLEKGPDAIPALYELLLRERDRDLRALVDRQLNGDKDGKGARFSTPEKIAAFIKTVKDSTGEPSRRLAACSALPATLLVRDTVAFKSQIVEALEFALADPTEDLQAAAARALEDCDDLDGLKERLVPHTVRLALNAEAMQGLRLKPEAIVEAIQKQYPRYKAQLVDDATVEVFVREAQRVQLVERFRLPDRSDIRLKDLLAREAAAQERGEKSKPKD